MAMDLQIEKMWKELENVNFHGNHGVMVLSCDWGGFKSGTPRKEITSWFNRNHSKGLKYLSQL